MCISYNTRLVLFYGDLDYIKTHENEFKYLNNEFVKVCLELENGYILNFEFAKYIHVKYGHNDSYHLAYSYLKNGVYTPDLNYKSLTLFECKDIEKLIVHEELHNVLSFYFTYNCDEYNFRRLKLNKRFYQTQTCINSGYPDYYDNNITEICFGDNSDYEYPLTDFPALRLYTSEGWIDEPYSSCPTNYDFDNITNFLSGKQYCNTSFNNFHVNDILINTNLAIYCFKNNLHLDYCISKFMMVCPEESLELYKKYRSFPRAYFNRYGMEKKCYEKYFEVEPRLRYLFFYYSLKYKFENIEYYQTDISSINLLEYNCLKASKYTVHESILAERTKTEKVCKLFDIDQCIWMDQ